jgi:NAD(P)H-flavin reductase
MAGSEGRFHPARLLARQDAGGGLTQMTIATPPRVVETYRSPGQYVEVRAEEQTGFFVLANEPGAMAWDLILRAGGGASDVLVTMMSGAVFEVTDAIGPGFPMSDVRGEPLIVALGGTGIAAGRPIVRRRIAEGDAARTHVFVGVRTPAELPIRADLESWMSAGVIVLVCLSKRDGSIGRIRHEHGYVQDVLRSHARDWSRAMPTSHAPTRIFTVGVASMVAALKLLAPELGIPPEHVYTNH